jgi:two-component system, NtrC family, response regulator HydG
MSGRILVVDDEPVVLDVLSEVLTREGFQVAQAPDSSSALQVLEREHQELVLCDIRMPGMDGFGLLREIARLHPGTDVILMTGYGSLDGAVEAMCLGAADYLIKPLKPKEVLARIRAILERRRLEAELHQLQGELRSRYDMHNIVAVSPRMGAVVAALRRVTTNEEPVVLHGEAGSGRSFLAKAIHYASVRRDRPFASLSCAPGTSQDVSVELFGQLVSERKVRRGQLERLQAGTLHLHEFELLPHAVQQRFAHAMRTQTYTRCDDLEVLPFQTRTVFTLSAPPAELIANGRLHPDLRHLEDVTCVQVPPLRQRNEDIPGLVANFVSLHMAEHGQPLQVDPTAIERLKAASYPGNVGQLFGLLKHCAALSPNCHLTAELVTLGLRQSDLTPSAPWAPMAEHLGDRERMLVMRAVNRHPGRLDQAAKELGISRTTLWRRMRKYGIRLPTG